MRNQKLSLEERGLAFFNCCDEKNERFLCLFGKNTKMKKKNDVNLMGRNTLTLKRVFHWLILCIGRTQWSHDWPQSFFVAGRKSSVYGRDL